MFASLNESHASHHLNDVGKQGNIIVIKNWRGDVMFQRTYLLETFPRTGLGCSLPILFAINHKDLGDKCITGDNGSRKVFVVVVKMGDYPVLCLGMRAGARAGSGGGGEAHRPPALPSVRARESPATLVCELRPSDTLLVYGAP